MMNRSSKESSPGRFLALVILFLLYVFPFILIIINSFKYKTDIVKQPLAIIGKHGFFPSNYKDAFYKMSFPRALWNSFYITVLSVFLIVIFAMMAAYIIARTDWKAGKILFGCMIASMAIPFQVIMIPLVSIYGAKLNVLNSPWTLILMHTGFGVSMAVFMFHGAIKTTIPTELEEAATIDGCGRVKTFVLIVVPLLKPTISTVVIIDSLAIWNDYLLPSLVLGKADLFTLPITARTFIGTFSSDYGLMMAGLVMSVIPILIMFIALQKYIISGVVSGAVKG